MSGRWPRYAVRIVALVALYYAAAHIGFALEFSGPVASIVWLPVGVGITFLYVGGLQYWPGVVAGDLLVNNYSTLPVGSALGQTCGNLLEVIIAAALLRAFCRRRPAVDSVSGLALAILALAAGTAISATIGGISLRLGRVVSTGALPEVWRTWWLGDLCGALLVLPLAVAWASLPTRPWQRRRLFEAALMIACAVALSAVALGTSRPLTYLVFPALIWAALRFGQRGATVAITIIAGFTLWMTTRYAGPFALHSASRSVLEAQLFIAVAALSTLFLGALVSERKQFALSVKASRARLVEAADNERRRLERNLHDGAQQRLVALTAHLRLAADEAHDHPQRSEGLFVDAQEEVLLAIEELRAIAHGINPPVLDEFGLAAAIESAATRATMPVELLEVPRTRLDTTTEVTAYYVILEAIANSERYAHASRVRVRANLSGRRLRIQISDDGVGGAVTRHGGGLEGLRDRVEAIGGSFSVESNTRAGTTITADIPASRRVHE